MNFNNICERVNRFFSVREYRDLFFNILILTLLFLSMLRTIMGGYWLWMCFYWCVIVYRGTSMVFEYQGRNLNIELRIMFKEWKMKNLFKLVDRYCEEMKSNVCERIMFNMGRKEKENILTEIVKEKGVSKIIMSFIEVENNIEDKMNDIECCSNLFDENSVECLLILRYIRGKLLDFSNFQKNMLFGSIFVSMNK